jgi:NAD(P)-dependent dehydrogenase (short-subunit alcohol dehydrogenase family)
VRSLVTGAARGLGEAIARRLAAEGGDVALVDVSPQVGDVASSLEHTYPEQRALAFVLDVADASEVDAAVAQVITTVGGLDLLVNNAGIGGAGVEVAEMSEAEWDRMMAVNLKGVFLCSRAAARVMKEQGAGCIINISSIYGRNAVPYSAHYCAAKAGVIRFTQSLALELAPFGVRANTICPGVMATEMRWEEVREIATKAGRSFDEQVTVEAQSLPLGRHGTGEDVASAVVFLASDQAAYITGETLNVHGGVEFV